MMKKKPKLCAYCGKDRSQGKFDMEHFAGKCLWAGPRPQMTRTVPVHVACNQAAKDDAEYLRDVLVMDESAGWHPEVQRLQATMQRKMKTHFSSIKKVLKGLKVRPVVTQSGLYLGEHPSFEIDWPRMRRALWNVMRGIHYSVRSEPMPQDVAYKIMIIKQSNVVAYKQIIDMMVPWQGFGDDVFACRYVFSPTQPGGMTCLMMFYKTRVFLGHSRPYHIVQAEPQPLGEDIVVQQLV
jgi:hypothetical protein